MDNTSSVFVAVVSETPTSTATNASDTKANNRCDDGLSILDDEGRSTANCDVSYLADAFYPSTGRDRPGRAEA